MSWPVTSKENILKGFCPSVLTLNIFYFTQFVILRHITICKQRNYCLSVLMLNLWMFIDVELHLFHNTATVKKSTKGCKIWQGV